MKAVPWVNQMCPRIIPKIKNMGVAKGNKYFVNEPTTTVRRVRVIRRYVLVSLFSGIIVRFMLLTEQEAGEVV